MQQAERHVREGERHVAHQRAILTELERDRHATEAEQARKVLATLEDSLRLARERLAWERRNGEDKP